MSRLVVFDLDGTLVDSRLDLATSANLLLGELGAPALPVEQIAGMVGDGARVLVQRVLAAAGLAADPDAALSRFLAIYDEHLLDRTALYPGIGDALDVVAARAPLAVLTNKPQHHTERLLDALGIRRYFFDVLGGDSAFPRKPDPAALLHLAAAASASPAETVMVGDSMVDFETARRASTHVCLVTYGFGQFEAGLLAQVSVCRRPEDLASALAALLQGNDEPAVLPARLPE